MIHIWRTPLLLIRCWYCLAQGKHIYPVFRREPSEFVGMLFSENLPTGMSKCELSQWDYIADHIVDLRIRAARRKRRNQ